MSRLVSSGFVAALALAGMAFTAPRAVEPQQAESDFFAAQSLPDAPTQSSPVAGVPADQLPAEGACRIWYQHLDPQNQPAQMDCEHATFLATRWGGRVITHDREIASYEGRNDFTGIPADALPRRGYCRPWIEGVAADRQPAESDCRAARQVADALGGRVLYMPL